MIALRRTLCGSGQKNEPHFQLNIYIFVETNDCLYLRLAFSLVMKRMHLIKLWCTSNGLRYLIEFRKQYSESILQCMEHNNEILQPNTQKPLHR